MFMAAQGHEFVQGSTYESARGAESRQMHEHRLDDGPTREQDTED